MQRNHDRENFNLTKKKTVISDTSIDRIDELQINENINKLKNYIYVFLKSLNENFYNIPFEIKMICKIT